MTVRKHVTVLKNVISQTAHRSVTLYFEPLVDLVHAIRRLIHRPKHAQKAGHR
jgi:hypothetical protein